MKKRQQWYWALHRHKYERFDPNERPISTDVEVEAEELRRQRIAYYAQKAQRSLPKADAERVLLLADAVEKLYESEVYTVLPLNLFHALLSSNQSSLASNLSGSRVQLQDGEIFLIVHTEIDPYESSYPVSEFTANQKKLVFRVFMKSETSRQLFQVTVDDLKKDVVRCGFPKSKKGALKTALAGV